MLYLKRYLISLHVWFTIYSRSCNFRVFQFTRISYFRNFYEVYNSRIFILLKWFHYNKKKSRNSRIKLKPCEYYQIRYTLYISIVTPCSQTGKFKLGRHHRCKTPASICNQRLNGIVKQMGHQRSTLCQTCIRPRLFTINNNIHSTWSFLVIFFFTIAPRGQMLYHP